MLSTVQLMEHVLGLLEDGRFDDARAIVIDLVLSLNLRNRLMQLINERMIFPAT